MSGYHVLVESKEDIDERPAAEVARALCEAYPGHPWHVNIQDGLLIIKHLRMSAKWGMIRKYGIIHDAARLKHECVMAAGEFLERAGLARGVAKDEPIVAVDGIPKKDLAIG